MSAAVGVLSRGGALLAATAAAERAADEAEEGAVDSMPQQLDEFGRDANVGVRPVGVEVGPSASCLTGCGVHTLVVASTHCIVCISC